MLLRSFAQKLRSSPALWVFAVIFTLRLWVLARFTSSPHFLPESDDMRFYRDWAFQIVGGHWTDHRAFYGLPGYPFLLACVFALVGYNPFAVGLLQIAADAGTAAVLFKIATAVFSNQRSTVANWRTDLIGFGAAVLWAFFQPAQAFSIILMPTSWLVFAFWLCVLWVLRTEKSGVWHPWFVLGLSTGLVAMMVATILFLLPLCVVAICLSVRRQEMGWNRWCGVVAASAILLAGAFAGISPAWFHNRFIARDPVLLSAHSGLNFWMGNSPRANGYPKIPEGLRAGQEGLLRDSISQAEADLKRPLKRSEVSQYWSAKANAYIREHFSDWVALLGLKLRAFWNTFQYDDLSVITVLSDEGVLLPGVRFGWLAALGIPGLLVAVWRFPESRWAAAAVILHMAALLSVFITERYRLCAAPGLALFGAFAVYDLWKRVAMSAWCPVAAWCLSIFFSAWIVSVPPREPGLWALDPFNTGLKALKANQLDIAERKLELAHAYVPENAEINFALGNLRLSKGNRTEAKRFYRQTLDLNPRHASALNNLGVLALEEHFSDAAANFFQAALSLEPANSKTWYLLAKARLAGDSVPQARSALQEALRLRPDQPEFRELEGQIEREQSQSPSRF